MPAVNADNQSHGNTLLNLSVTFYGEVSSFISVIFAIMSDFFVVLASSHYFFREISQGLVLMTVLTMSHCQSTVINRS